MENVVIVGVGNPILSDDGVGIKVVDELQKIFFDHPQINFELCYSGGLRLMEMLKGFETAIIVDAIETQDGNAGDMYRLTMEDLSSARNLSSIHDLDLLSAIE